MNISEMMNPAYALRLSDGTAPADLQPLGLGSALSAC